MQIDRDDILAAADAADERRRAGEARSAFDGMPVGMKDVIAVKGQPLTCASRMLANFIAPYDATVTTRLRAAGLIPAGRLNMDEFAMGSSTENSALGKTRNPVDLTRAPGGLLRRQRRRRGRTRNALDPWFRYRRQHPPTRRLLWHCRPQTDLRTRLALRPRGLRLLARSNRADGADS